MPKNPKAHYVLYERKTAATLLSEALGGKYFQYRLRPGIITHIPLRAEFTQDGRAILATLPLDKNRMTFMTLARLNHYVEISESQVQEYQRDPAKLEGIVLVHKDSPAGRDLQS